MSEQLYRQTREVTVSEREGVCVQDSTDQRNQIGAPRAVSVWAKLSQIQRLIG